MVGAVDGNNQISESCVITIIEVVVGGFASLQHQLATVTICCDDNHNDRNSCDNNKLLGSPCGVGG